MLAELPDLWDVNVSDWSHDSRTSRFAAEGYQEEFVRFVKTVTTKPVVGVGRFTSPDAMVSQIRRGVLDLIGAARPSIADPFLPRKIENGDIDDIRECIGCNVCVSGDYTMTPIRCTQNPTMGEEWRKGWHPERVPPRSGDDDFLMIGAGPAGLECARVLGQRGHARAPGRCRGASRRPGDARDAACRDSPPGRGCATIGWARSTRWPECRDRARQPGELHEHAGDSAQSGWCSRPGRAGGATASDARTSADPGPGRGAEGVHSRRCDGRSGAARPGPRLRR